MQFAVLLSYHAKVKEEKLPWPWFCQKLIVRYVKVRLRSMPGEGA